MLGFGLLQIPMGIEGAQRFGERAGARGLVQDSVGVLIPVVVFVLFGLGYFAKSIVVTPEVMVIQRWWRSQAFSTREFVGIRRQAWSAGVIEFANGESAAPWFHPNLEPAIRSAIADFDRVLDPA